MLLSFFINEAIVARLKPRSPPSNLSKKTHDSEAKHPPVFVSGCGRGRCSSQANRPGRETKDASGVWLDCSFRPGQRQDTITSAFTVKHSSPGPPETCPSFAAAGRSMPRITLPGTLEVSMPRLGTIRATSCVTDALSTCTRGETYARVRSNSKPAQPQLCRPAPKG